MNLFKNIFFAVLGGFQYGYNATVIGGALIFLSSTFFLTPFQEGLLVSCFFLGGILSTSFAGILANKIGRKNSLITSALFYLLGTLLSTFAISYPILLASRFIAGIGGGIAVSVIPIYCTEIAPIEKRGAMAHANQIAMALGALAAYLSNYFFASSQNVQAMFSLGCYFAFFQLIALFFITDTISHEDQKMMKTASWKNLIAPPYRSRLMLCIGLNVFQQITGITAILYYAPYIFAKAGFDAVADAAMATIGIGFINALSITTSFWLIDRAGRRLLLIISLCGMTIGLLAISYAFFTESSNLHLIAVGSLMLYIASYALGLGPIPPLVIAEVFPLKLRGHAMSITSFIGWIATFSVAFSFLHLTHYLTPPGAFFLFAVFAIFALYFTFRRVLETKQKSIDEIEKMFSHK